MTMLSLILTLVAAFSIEPIQASWQARLQKRQKIRTGSPTPLHSELADKKNDILGKIKEIVRKLKVGEATKAKKSEDEKLKEQDSKVEQVAGKGTLKKRLRRWTGKPKASVVDEEAVITKSGSST